MPDEPTADGTPSANATPETTVRAYLDALSEHDLDRCMSFFSPDASIEMMNAKHVGRDEIAEWHRQRFEADLKFDKIQGVKVKGDTVVVDAAISTKRLKFYRLNSVNGRATVKVRDGVITESKLAMKSYNPIEALKFK
jgi:uncharacterized protein (TIGR02246 family)